MYSYDFTPIGETEPAIHKDVTYELEQYPVDETEKDLEKHCTPAIRGHIDRKSTRLNSSHLGISYAVFCLKKKKKIRHTEKDKSRKENRAEATERGWYP